MQCDSGRIDKIRFFTAALFWSILGTGVLAVAGIKLPGLYLRPLPELDRLEPILETAISDQPG